MIAPPLVPSACPACRAPLTLVGEDQLHCPAGDHRYPRRDGVWRLLTAAAAASAEPFLAGYRTVRRAESWGHDDARYYRRLPFRDRSGRHSAIWRIRAISYGALRRRIVEPLHAEKDRSLRVLDLGAGNGWLAHLLAHQGHHVAALDLDDDPRDGLGAHRHYGMPPPFLPVQATFDRLPYADQSVDVVIFNGALHYSAHYPTTLGEALRVLAPGGRLAILDSPFYRQRASGEAMVRERDAAFRARHGPGCGTVTNQAFLTLDQLETVGSQLGVTWRVWRPWYGWRWALRPFVERWRGRREPARFFVVAGSRQVPAP